MSERERQPASGEWRVPVGGDETSAAFDPPITSGAGDGAADVGGSDVGGSDVRGSDVRGPDDGVVFVCAHGAGGNMNDRSILQTAKALRDRGLGVVRFNFLYKERKSGRPDPMPRLKECLSAVIARARQELEPKMLIIGGRSMGGRAASMLAAEDYECDGLLLLAYPLHPPGKPDQLRDAHLPAIKVPVICFNGTRDAFCTPALMDKVLTRVTTDWEMHWMDGADHSFHVPKSSGKTDSQVLAEIGDATQAWVTRLTNRKKPG